MGMFRLLLALSVVAHHTGSILWLPLVNGRAAVQIFFVISGFYMALVLNEKYVGPGSYSTFIVGRIARIYPLYFLMAALTLVLTFLVPSEIQLPNLSELAHMNLTSAVWVVVSQFVILGQDLTDLMSVDHGVLSFVADSRNHDPQFAHYMLLPQAWSLSIELMFYAIAPLIVRRISLTIALMLISAAVQVGLFHVGLWGTPWPYSLFPAVLCLFLLGALFYHLRRSPIYLYLYENTGPTILFATALGIFNFAKLPLGMSYALMMIGIPCVFDLTKRRAFDRLLGELSFPIYMVHYFIIFAARGFFPEWSASWKFGSFVGLASIAMAIVAYAAVIVPVDRWRVRRVKASSIRLDVVAESSGALA